MRSLKLHSSDGGLGEGGRGEEIGGRARTQDL